MLIVFFVFVGILLSWRDVTTLKADMDKRFDRVDKQLDTLTVRVSGLERDYTNFYGMQYKMDGRFDDISARVK